MPMRDRAITDRDGEVRFPATRLAVEDDVASIGDRVR
jgi:hypothetical protein